jgi:hypothetical protein
MENAAADPGSLLLGYLLLGYNSEARLQYA